MAIHKDLGDAELHEPKGMLPLTAGAADIGKVITSKGDGTSEARFLVPSEVGAQTLPARRVVINTLADFPAPVADVITLASNTQYFIGTQVLMGNNRLVMGDFTTIKGIDGDNGNLVYADTGTFITSTDVSWTVEDLTINAENGKVFDHTDSSGEFLRLRNVFISKDTNIGTFNSTGDSVMLVETLIISASTGTGMEFTGNWNLLQLSLGSTVQVSGTFIDLGTATFNSVGISECSVFLVTSGSTFLKGAAGSANINAGGLGRVTNSVITDLGGGTILDGIADDDVRWRFLNSPPIRDTRPDALASFAGGVTETVISIISTPTEVLATWTVADTTQFTVTTDGRFTFIGETDTTMPIQVRLTGTMAAGGQKSMLACIAINGVAVTNSIAPFFPTNSQADTALIIWQHRFVNGDYVEVFVSNESDTTNFVAESAVALIN